MSIRKINFVEGEYYHIYNRGNSKQKIFHDTKDYRHFLDLLYLLNTKNNITISNLKRYETFDLHEINSEDNLVAIGAYVLMPNHFHILITEKIEGGISKFMQKVSTAYVMYYNKKYNRTGGLFEGKFKSQHLNTDKYLKYIFSYIHLNPIKLIQKDWKEKGIKNKKEAFEYLNKYEYSSFLDYLKDDNFRKNSKILKKKSFPNYFLNSKEFTTDILSWLDLKQP
jgi:putative transposase